MTEPVHKIQFMDLNADCHMLILDNLSIIDLYSFSKTSKYFANLFEDVLRQKFAKKIVIFRTCYPDKLPTTDFEEIDESIQLKNPNI